MHKNWPTSSVSLLRSPRILLRRHALRFQETCFGVTAVRREIDWGETALKEQNKVHGQKLSTLIWISSVLIRPGPLPSLEGVCVAQSRYGVGYGMDDRGMIVRFLVAKIFCTLNHNLQIWSKDDLTFYSTGSRVSFVWVEGIQRVTPVIVVYVAGCKWKYRSIWYT